MSKPILPANVTAEIQSAGQQCVVVSGDINGTHYHFWASRQLAPSGVLYQHLKREGNTSSTIRTLDGETERGRAIVAAMLAIVRREGMLEKAAAVARETKARKDAERKAEERAELEAAALELAAPALLAAARRGVAALEANGAPNCEAAKELRAAIAAAEVR
jgi:hypothetical protein